MTETIPHRILVGIDDSEEARAAARYAVHVAERTRDEVLLAHAYEPWPDDTSDRQVEELRRRSVESAQRLLETAVETLGSPDVTVRTTAAGEKPRSLLGRLATQARLVVVGKDTARFTDRLTYGSVAAHLAKTAPCPVVIVPAGWRPQQFGDHPVLALAEGGVAPETLTTALAEAARIGRSVVVLRSIPYLASHHDVERDERQLGEAIAGVHSRHRSVPVRTLVVRGDLDEQMIRHSVGASAAVVGRPPGGITTWMRSAAHAVVKRTRCPLIIVPTEHARASDEPTTVAGSARQHG